MIVLKVLFDCSYAEWFDFFVSVCLGTSGISRKNTSMAHCCHLFNMFFSFCCSSVCSNPRRSASRNRLHNTTPARLEGKGQAPQVQGQGRAGSVSRGGRSNTTSAAASKDSNNNKKESTAGNARSKGATSASPPKRPVSAAGECTCFDLLSRMQKFRKSDANLRCFY